MNAISGSDLRSSFAQGILALLERVEYRRIRSHEDFIDVENLRRSSYLSKECVNTQEFGSFVDEYDFDSECHVFGVYLDETLVSTIRIHIVTDNRLHGPTAQFFPERAKFALQNSSCYVDPSRFAADQQALWTYPAIPFLTLRLAAAASEFFNAGYCMSFVREDHAQFYRRSFGALDLEAPRIVQDYVVPVVLLGAKIEDIRHRIATRYPFFQSSELERRMLFAPESELDYPPLNILPSAKHVLKSMGIQPSVQSVNL